MSQASSLEQLMLEQINAARKAAGVQPLAFDDNLNTAAENHSKWMIDSEIFSHTGINGSSPGDRIKAAGYSFTGSWAWGENIAWTSTRGDPGFSDEVLQLHINLMNSPGHKANILKPDFKEIGIGFEVGSFKGFNSAVVTEDFAKIGSNSFITGVAFNDLDKDNLYDINEGLSGLNVSARNVSSGLVSTTKTGISGGYQIELVNGTYELNLGGKVSQVVINSKNVKVDSITTGMQEAPVNNGVNGTESRDRLIGSSGNDTINGFAGNDTINGRGGFDLLNGGSGRDAFVFNTLDGSVDKITDFAGDLILIDGNVANNVTFAGGVLSSNGQAFVEIVGSFNLETDLYVY